MTQIGLGKKCSVLNRAQKIYYFKTCLSHLYLRCTDLLSPQMWVALFMGMPIIHNLQCIPLRVSTPVFMTTNSVPKVHVAIVDCLLEYQLIRALLRYSRKSLHDLCVHCSCAWSLLTSMYRSNTLPIASGALGGIDSVISPQNSLQLQIGNCVLSMFGYVGFKQCVNYGVATTMTINVELLLSVHDVAAPCMMTI